MSQSVKLTDGSYIDASAVYDTTQGKTQEAVNSSVANTISGLNSSVNGLNSYKTLLGLAGTNTGYWHNSFTEGLKIFYYEGSDTSTYKIPVKYCFVIVARRDYRGVAIAIQWNGGTSGITNAWVNRLHDDTGAQNWAGWTKITTTSST